jgi:hypothetical protein
MWQGSLGTILYRVLTEMCIGSFDVLFNVSNIPLVSLCFCCSTLMHGLEVISSITSGPNLNSNDFPFVETVTHQAKEPVLVGSSKTDTADI